MFPGVYDQTALATIQAVFDDIRYQSDHAESVLADAVPMRTASLARALLNAADAGIGGTVELKARTFALLTHPIGAIVIPIGRADAARSRARITLAPWSAKDDVISFKPLKSGFRPDLSSVDFVIALLAMTAGAIKSVALQIGPTAAVRVPGEAAPAAR